MPVGLGGGGAVGVAIETTNGTFEDPTVWVPIISETFRYTENRYFSEQLRQQVMDSDVKQGFYHIEGDIVMEVDTHFLPYFQYASRHTTTKTGTGPYVYKSVPNKTASVDAAVTGGAKTLSITAIRNDVLFGYAGCVVGSYAFEIVDGVLRVTLAMMGLSQEHPAGPYTPVWADPDLLGADAHAVFVGSAAAVPTFGAASNDFNGMTMTFNHNPTAENRIRKDRAASYIAFHKTDVTFNTELDFVDATEYDKFVATTQAGIKMESTQGTGDFDTESDGTRLQINRFAYETYDVDLPGMGDIIMAGVTGHGLSVTGGDGYEIHCKSATNIA
jgi:Phage tail tube protein